MHFFHIVAILFIDRSFFFYHRTNFDDDQEINIFIHLKKYVEHEISRMINSKPSTKQKATTTMTNFRCDGSIYLYSFSKRCVGIEKQHTHTQNQFDGYRIICM